MKPQMLTSLNSTLKAKNGLDMTELMKHPMPEHQTMQSASSVP